LGNHQGMDLGLRVDVLECVGPLVLVDLGRGYFAAQDLREDIVVVVGLRRVDRHYPLLEAFSSSPDTPSRRSSSVSTSSSGMSLAESRTMRWKIRSAASPTSSSRSPANAATAASTASSPTLRAITGRPRAWSCAT